jgi:hypothetical protein
VRFSVRDPLLDPAAKVPRWIAAPARTGCCMNLTKSSRGKDRATCCSTGRPIRPDELTMRATPPAGIPRAEARAGSESLLLLNFAKIELIMTAISCYAAPPEMGDRAW